MPQSSVLPVQRPLLDDIDEARQEKPNKQQYLDKSVPSQPAEIHRIGIEKITSTSNNTNKIATKKIFDGHRGGVSIANAFDTTFKVLEFFGGLPGGAEQVGDTEDQAYKAQRKYRIGHRSRRNN